MTVPLVIIGCGGFGREVFALVDCLTRAGGEWAVQGFVDDAPRDVDLERVRMLGSDYLGAVSDLTATHEDVAVVVAIGHPLARESVVARLVGSSVHYPCLVHPDATIAQPSALGDGTVVAAGARLNTNVIVGRHVHIDQNATVGHDSRIGDFSRLNPQACVSGSVDIGRSCLVGASATILQGLTIGDHAVTGASACVVRDVPTDTTVKGVPAR